MFDISGQNNLVIARRKERSAVLFTLLMLLTSYSAIEFAAWEAMGSTDADGDGLPYGLEYYINTQPQDWDSDGDGICDNFETRNPEVCPRDCREPPANGDWCGDGICDALENCEQTCPIDCQN